VKLRSCGGARGRRRAGRGGRDRGASATAVGHGRALSVRPLRPCACPRPDRRLTVDPAPSPLPPAAAACRALTSYTVISTGMMSPAILAVAALYSLQNAMMFTPWGGLEKAGWELELGRGGEIGGSGCRAAQLHAAGGGGAGGGRGRAGGRPQQGRPRANAARGGARCVPGCCIARARAARAPSGPPPQPSAAPGPCRRGRAARRAAAAAARRRAAAAHLGTERGTDGGRGVGLARLQLQLDFARHCEGRGGGERARARPWPGPHTGSPPPAGGNPDGSPFAALLTTSVRRDTPTRGRCVLNAPARLLQRDDAISPLLGAAACYRPARRWGQGDRDRTAAQWGRGGARCGVVDVRPAGRLPGPRGPPRPRGGGV
jgi:hypothetical protein